MNIKKSMIISLSSLILLTPSLNSTFASASNWHKGVPNKLRGYWKGNGNVVAFDKNYAGILMKNATSGLHFSNPIYKSTGHNRYIIKTSNNSYNNGGKVSGSWYNVTYSKNHTHIKYDGKSYGYFHHSNTIE